MKNVKVLVMLLALVSMLMVGCKKEGKSGTTSNVKFNLTDAPGNFDSLMINVQAIQVHTTAGGWVTLASSLGTINILSYVNGNAALAAEGQIAAGSIDQIRLVLGSNNSVAVNGHSFSLSAASSAALQSALTINVSGQLQGGSNYVFTVDFDAAQSVTLVGGSSYQLNPVIRLIVDQTTTAGTGGSGGGLLTIGGSDSSSINIGSGGITVTGSGTGSGSVTISGNGTGNISGSISPVGVASVCITASNGSTFCTMTSLTGQFSMQALGAGTYTVTIKPVVSILSNASAHVISNVSITAGQTTNLGVVAM